MVEKRVSLVTGASSGIGRAIALRFGSKGMRVGLVARRKDRLAQVAAAIVNIGSVVGLVGTPRGTAYVGTKWALRGMNECWREELYPDGVKVAYVAPGYVITEFGGRKEDLSLPEAEWALTPDDVVHAVECIVDQGPNSDIKEIVVQVRDRS